MSAHVFRTSSDPEWINCDWLERLIFYGLWTLSCRDGDTTLIEGLCIICQIGLGDASIKVFSLDSAVLLCLLICRVVKLLSKYPRVQVHLNMCSEPVPSYVSLIDKCNVCEELTKQVFSFSRKRKSDFVCRSAEREKPQLSILSLVGHRNCATLM